MSQTMVDQQLLQTIQMIVFGWLLMFSADEKKVLAAEGRWSYHKKTAGDFSFCLLWGILFWLFLMEINGGLLRNYILFGLLGGCFFYHTLCRRWCAPVCLYLAKGILWGSQKLCWLLLLPWRLLSRLLWRPCCSLWNNIYQHRQELSGEGENIIENKNNFLT